MALINDPRLYSGGSAVFDSRPHTQLYANLMARKQARDDAYDEYIRNLNKSINPAGLRNQERAVFEDKLRKWQEMGIKNKELLRNPRKDQGQASMEFQAGYQDLLNTINESKAEEEKKKPLIEIMTDPAKRDRLNEDEVFPRIQQHDQPIFTQDPKTGQWVRDPNRRSFNVADLNFDPKPFEQDRYFKSFDDVKPSNKSQVVKKLPGFKEEITTTSIYSSQDKDKIATRSVAEYMNNKSFKKTVDELDPSEYNDFYKANFGHDIQTPADLAAAYTLRGIQAAGTSTEVKDDKYAQALNLEGIKNANRKQLLRMRQAMAEKGKEGADTWVDAYIKRTVLESQKPQNRQTYKFKDGKTINGYKIPLDPTLRKAIGLDLGKTNGTLIATDDGDFIIAPYKTNDKYEPIKGKDGTYSIDTEKASKITSDQLKLALSKIAAGVKQTNIEMTEDNIEDDELGILD